MLDEHSKDYLLQDRNRLRKWWRKQRILSQNSYFLSIIDDTLATFSELTEFLTLNLKTGYLQVDEMLTDGKENTAFATNCSL